MLLFQLLPCPQERLAVRGTHHKAWQPFHSLKEGGLGGGAALLHRQEQDSASPTAPVQVSRTPTVLMFGNFLILSREDVKKIYIRNASGKRGINQHGMETRLFSEAQILGAAALGFIVQRPKASVRGPA